MISNPNLKVAIIIPTINRPDFITRQLRYYVSVRCPHAVYIGDSSNKENSQKIQAEVENLKKYLDVKYFSCPNLDDRQTMRYILSQAPEEYACFIGDDDYQIPSSLTKCAEFLQINPDYTTAHGYAVSFRLDRSGPYGNLNRVAPYPQLQIEQNNASERIVEYFKKYFVIQFSVHRRKQMLEYYSQVDEIPDKSFSAELLPCSMAVIDGKSKLIDALGFVRQTHGSRFRLPNLFDWITQDIWAKSYITFENILGKALSEKDKIDFDKAKSTIRQAFWIYLYSHLKFQHEILFPEKSVNNSLNKKILDSSFASIYRKIFKPKVSRLHHKVLDPNSPYFQDFKPVMDSFSKL